MQRPACAAPHPSKSPHPPTPHPPPYALGGVLFDHGRIVVGGVSYDLSDRLLATDTHDIAVAGGVASGTDRATYDAWTMEWEEPPGVWLFRPHTPALPAFPPLVEPKKRDTTGLVPHCFVAEFGDVLTRQNGPGGVYEDGRVLTPDKRIFPARFRFREQWEGGEAFCDGQFIGFKPSNGDPPTLFWLPSWFGAQLHIVYLGPPEPPSWMDRLRAFKVRTIIIALGVFLNAIAAVVTSGASLCPGLFLFAIMLAVLFWETDAPKVPDGYL